MNIAEHKTYDVIVVGAGSMGMSAGYELARRGVKVLLVDAFNPPHTEGSHHGDTRLIRHAYSGDPAYIGLALRADTLWQEAEQLSGSELLVRSGVLNLADRKVYSFGGRVAEAQQRGVQAELLEAAEIRRRWPGLTLPESITAMYEPEAGYLYSERCISAYRKLALAHGAELLTDTPVLNVTARGGSVKVHTAGGDIHAAGAILSAGAWFSGLAPFVQLPIKAVRKVVGWFESSTDYAAGRFPGFTLGAEVGGYYGFPSIGGAGLKVGRHDTGQEWKPGEPLRPFGSEESDEGDLRRVLEAYMPGAAGRLLKGSVCKYEHTPDENFIIDRHPLHANVLIAGGFSGHGFKFSSVVGEILADLAIVGTTGHNISPFALSRFATA
ncbi:MULTISPECIES: N-methyl-L-tryptophan oxidase [unclassified Paenibacillus]|uniref:N-methyl-L-tryptophan oxidase n=1 Tax=unclassified Paenibacillus TaxID=185978 RepID=UPI002405AD82|nr:MULTISPECIES: N-methyl-L-tryptophan oxidase [unclassified Paenibacillus]MDF9843483.1 N-methyl-L-tryptophan oxidase [Paenibacillus sp. PastF-2]MDF9850071.1 N-methyl-L-tryptophan oxidase [Paenibacillus sp. PastM-2]MDF9857725.1 N-methyl-L-tryptophan oxidase [Paenibacillus sp. PastF-1]MDH6482992.1 N-methyl-L-tryptophan oxidase [Paenibacillus sp. PastH-2]MDH6509205.1 N-methyl-L-tryptophan oxidase [Paenibacillus sp. PastM-3]